MKADEAGRRLILLALPFAAFGLLWILAPPLEERLGAQLLTAMRALGWALTGLSVAAIGFGVWLVSQKGERIL